MECVVVLQYSGFYIGLYMLLILGIVCLGITIAVIAIIIVICRAICKQQERPLRVSHLKRQETISKRAAQPVSSQTQPMQIQLAMCPECEATILAEAKVCPHCGNPRPICMVCQLPIQYGDSVLICPHCKGQAHRVHLLEYLKVKGSCPNCQTDLDQHELVAKANLNSSEA